MLNVGSSIVHFYLDGSIHVNSQGCEMGNSYTTKVSQVAANQLGLSVDKIKIPGKKEIDSISFGNGFLNKKENIGFYNFI